MSVCFDAGQTAYSEVEFVTDKQKLHKNVTQQMAVTQTRYGRVKLMAKLPMSELESKLLGMAEEAGGWDDLREKLKKILVVAALKRCKGRQNKAAELLKLHRNTVNRALESL